MLWEISYTVVFSKYKTCKTWSFNACVSKTERYVSSLSYKAVHCTADSPSTLARILLLSLFSYKLILYKDVMFTDLQTAYLLN